MSDIVSLQTMSSTIRDLLPNRYDVNTLLQNILEKQRTLLFALAIENYTNEDFDCFLAIRAYQNLQAQLGIDLPEIPNHTLLTELQYLQDAGLLVQTNQAKHYDKVSVKRVLSFYSI